ncbi:MAG: hypothetical protein ABIW38_06895, partial [Ferruginibacter sp.]
MRRIAIIAAYFFICLDCFAQLTTSSGQYPFVHYTPRDGLVNSRVTKAYQDSKGRMYFLTHGGLSVFDGARFRNYTTKNGLANNIVNDILEVGDDSMLIATNSSNFLNVLVKGNVRKLKTEGARCPLVNQFYRNQDGKIYLSSDDGLFVLENNKVKELNVSTISKYPALPYLSVISCYENYIVISLSEMKNRRGLYLYDIKSNRICDALPDQGFYLLGKDYNETIWVANSDKLYILDTAFLTKGKLLLTLPTDGFLQVKNYSTTNIAFENDRIWLLYKNKDYRNIEIHRIEKNGSLFRIPLPQQATASDIKNIFIDRENSIWLCNDGEAVFKIVNAPFHIFQNPLGVGTQSQVNNVFYNNYVTWYSTNTEKLFRKTGKVVNKFTGNIKNSPAVFYDHGNKILAYDSRNIYEAHVIGASNLYFKSIISLPDSDFFEKKMIVDHDGVIIAAQKSCISVWVGLRLIMSIPIDRNDVVEEIYIDKNKLLWIVTRFNGIDVFKFQTEAEQKYLQSFYHFTPDNIIGSPRSFVIDRTGLIWIGTRADGLVAYKQNNGRLDQVYHFDVGNGLTDNFITSLSCDSFNNIIVGTQTGLDRIIIKNQKSNRVENLTRASNYFALINQTWADKEYAYGLTFSGVLLEVSPGKEKKSGFSPLLILEEMKVNAQPVSAEKNTFSYKENNISFFIAAPSFVDEKEVTYTYLVEGSGNSHWSDTTVANAVINLTNLSAGKYMLKMKAFFPSGLYAATGLSYSFEIMPPWWQTWWFRIIIAILIIGLLVFSFRFYYKRKLEKQMATLEKQQAIE